MNISTFFNEGNMEEAYWQTGLGELSSAASSASSQLVNLGQVVKPLFISLFLFLRMKIVIKHFEGGLQVLLTQDTT